MTVVYTDDGPMRVDDTVEEIRARYLSGDDAISMIGFDGAGQAYIFAISRAELLGCYDGKDGPAFWTIDPRDTL